MIAGAKTALEIAGEQLPAVLKRIAAGERAPFDSIVTAYWSVVLAYVWKRVPAADAEDLAQGSFLSLYRTLRKGHAVELTGTDALRRYLLTCARSQVTDYYRRRRAEEPVGALEELLHDEASVARGGEVEAGRDALVTQEEGRAVQDCLGKLEPRERSICWLHYVDGRSKREIAAALKIPESSFRVLMTRALGALRRCLERKGVV